MASPCSGHVVLGPADGLRDSRGTGCAPRPPAIRVWPLPRDLRVSSADPDDRQLVKIVLVAINAALIAMGTYASDAAVGLNSTLLAALLISIFFNTISFYATWVRSIPLVYLVQFSIHDLGLRRRIG